MSMLNKDFKKKILELKRNKLLDDKFYLKAKTFKDNLDDFKLINSMDDDFFKDVYLKNFVDILDFESQNNFQYTKVHILEIEESIKKLSLERSNIYSNVLDYMILKISDVNDETYGTIISFINEVFNDIKYTIELTNEVQEIWKKDYSKEFLTFNDFEKTSLYQDITSQIISIKNDNFFNLNDKKEIFEFLIYCSEHSDSYLVDLNDLEESLFNDEYESYKKYGQKILFDIKNKVVSYN
jgi:hypothetical protein